MKFAIMAKMESRWIVKTNQTRMTDLTGNFLKFILGFQVEAVR